MGNPEGFLPQAQRTVLGQNAMYHLGDPTNIDQGTFNTCTVTTMQEKLFTTAPAVATDMLTQAALSGKYVNPKGRVIELDKGSMEPMASFKSGDAMSAKPVDGNRSFATQVLNHVMANEITQQKDPPQIYKQLHRLDNGDPLPSKDTGERLYINGKENTIPKGRPNNSPEISVADMANAIERYTGERNVLMMEGGWGGQEPGLIKAFNSPKELGEHILARKMPAILYLNGKDAAITGYPPPNSADHGAHVVSIRDYDPKTGLVTISNQWGSKNDIKVPIDKLYAATRPLVRPDGKTYIQRNPR
jgi:hypothetical protein